MKKLYLFCFLLLTAFAGTAQTTISTAGYVTNSPYFFSSGGSFVTFTIRNNNAYPVRLTDLSVFQLPVYSNNLYKLYFSSTSIGGVAAPLTAPTWNLIATATAPITTTTQVDVVPFKCIGFVIPASTTYRFALEGSSGGMFRASGLINGTNYTCSPNMFSSAGVDLLVGDYNVPGFPGNTGNAGVTNIGTYSFPAYFQGSVTVAPANSFTDLYINSVTKPSTICSQSNAVMSATLCNRSSQAVNFATNNATVNFTVNGPNGIQTQSVTLNSGIVEPCNCVAPTIIGVNYSAAGTYTLTATASIAGVSDVNPGNNTFTDSITNYKPTLSPVTDSICQNAPPAGFNPFTASNCLSKSGSITVTLATNPVPPADGNSDATCGLNFASGNLPALPSGAVVTGGKLLVTNLRNNTGSTASEVRLNLYGPAPNGPASPFVPSIGGNQNNFTYYNFGYDMTLIQSQVQAMYNALGPGGTVSVGYWETIDQIVGGADIQLNAQSFPTETRLQINYVILPEAKWYNTPSAGTLLTTGPSFNPFFVTGGIPNTATPGTTTFYVACNTDTVCRLPLNVLIKPSPVVNQDTLDACEIISSTGNAIFDLTTLNANVSNNAPGATVLYYLDNSLTSMILNPAAFNTSSAVIFSKVQIPGGCFSSDSVILNVNAKPDFPTGLITVSDCAPVSVNALDWIDPFSTVPLGSDTLYYHDPGLTQPFLNPTNITASDTVYMVFQTPSTPACYDTTELVVTIIPVNSFIAGQDTTFNISIAGNAGCNTVTMSDGLTELIKTNTDCRRLATITDVVDLNSLGNVTICEDIQSSVPFHNGQPYVTRSYQITAANSDSAYICLYYLEDDFQQYNASALFNSPTWPLLPSMGGPANLGNIAVTKVDNGDLNTPGHTAMAIPSADISATYDPLNTVWTVCFPVSGFSYFYLHALNPNNIPLPLNMLSFVGERKGETSVLNWVTTNETNLSHFVVERSRDAQNFSVLSNQISSKALAGNSQEVLSYGYTDLHPMQGHNYYRLRVHDLDGRQSLSSVVDVYRGEQAVVTLYPNPAHNVLNADMIAQRATHATLQLSDATGRTVKTIQVLLQEGANTLSIDLEGLSAGLYTIRMSNGQGLHYSQTVQKL